MRSKITSVGLSLVLVCGMVPTPGFAGNVKESEAQSLVSAEVVAGEESPLSQDASIEEGFKTPSGVEAVLENSLVSTPQDSPVAQGEETSSLAANETNIDIDWYLDDTSATEFIIATPAELRGLSALVNGTAKDGSGQALPAVGFEGATIFQYESIVMYEGSGASAVATAFEAIGSPEHPFAGSYFAVDGATISGLRIEAETGYQGLFGYVSSRDSVLSGIALEAGPTTSGGKPVGGIYVSTSKNLLTDIGSVVGFTAGSVEYCSSSLTVQVTSNGEDLSSEEQQEVVERVGGVAGSVRGDMSDCGFSGLLDVLVAANVAVEGDTYDSLRVGACFGGVVGRFGEPDDHGTMSNCSNEGTVFTRTTGHGATDRFGTTTYANVYYVGGIVGYSNGSIYDCKNGTYNPLLGVASGVVSTSSLDTPSFTKGGATSGTLLNNRGADQTGGIVGGLRSTSEVSGKYNDGDPNDPMEVVNCRNQGQITGLCGTGGIVGEMGVYCSIISCYNGDPEDTTQVAGKVVTTRWNKPISGGILGRTNGGTVAYCANYAEIRNIQTGYYMAGIAGALFTSDDHPEKLPEMYSCLNTGGVYTVNTAAAMEYREAGICGQNEGYVHECLSMDGSVPYHNNACIGDNDWGLFANLESRPKAELQTADSAAFLNAQAASSQDFSYYWFINGSGFPVLNTWVNLDDSKKTSLTLGSEGTVASVETLADAPYVGGEGGSLPQLKVTLKDGTVLVQNTDFYVIPQKGAVDMTTTPVYRATVVGLGCYKGTMEDCVLYGIGASTLSDATVRASSMDYNGGALVFPTSVVALLGTSVIDSKEYDYVIYSAHVNANMVENGQSGCTVAFDSEGYVSYTESGVDKVPVSQVGAATLNVESRPYWLWDRNGEKIADSQGYVYYTNTSGGGIVGRAYADDPTEGLMRFVSNTPAGYVVKVMAKSDSQVLTGSVLGSYVVNTLDLFRECSFVSAEVQGVTWYWDSDAHCFYVLDGQGKRVEGMPMVTFTGESITPHAVIFNSAEEGAYQLRENVDFRAILGDPDAEEEYPNRNVTDYAADPKKRACATYRPVDTSRYSNYIVAFFGIAPAAFEDCSVSIDSDQWAYTGSPVTPTVTVKLDGVELIEGVDYTVEYSNNTKKGTASYTVTALENLQGGESLSYTGTFTIKDGIDLSSYTLDAIADQQYNYGYDVHPSLTFRNASGAKVTLREGVDYSVSYSTTDVTKATGTNPDGKSIASEKDPCKVTISGIGLYTGQLQGTMNIVPYDAATNATNQLRATVQSIALEDWKDQTQPPFNMGLNNPVVNVMAYPITDWTAYGEGRFEEAYGDPIVIGSSLNNETKNGATIQIRPVRYYVYDGKAKGGLGDLVSCDGSSISNPYETGSKTTLATKKAPANTPLIATIAMRVGTGTNSRNGAVGILTVSETFVVSGPFASQRGDVNGNGAINVVDAQVSYDLATGVYGENYVSFPLPTGWSKSDLIHAADANEDGAIDASDARLIQYFALTGSWSGDR